jgi:ABC-type dipeptide/oligopeptide/nickel transport system ATPase subunit
VETIKELVIALSIKGSTQPLKDAGVALRALKADQRDYAREAKRTEDALRREAKALEELASKGSAAKRALAGIGGALAGLTGQSGTLSSAAGAFALLKGGPLGIASAASATVQIVGGVAKSASDLASNAAQVQAVFQNLAFSIEPARKATQGLVDDFTLARAANQLVSLGVVKNASEFADLAGAAQKLGAKLGIDTARALESLAAGLGRNSTEMLDNLGIVLKVEQAHKLYADSLGKTVDQLSDTEKAEAFRVTAMRKIQEAATGVKLEYDAVTASVLRADAAIANTWTRGLGGRDFASGGPGEILRNADRNTIRQLVESTDAGTRRGAEARLRAIGDLSSLDGEELRMAADRELRRRVAIEQNAGLAQKESRETFVSSGRAAANLRTLAGFDELVSLSQAIAEGELAVDSDVEKRFRELGGTDDQLKELRDRFRDSTNARKEAPAKSSTALQQAIAKGLFAEGARGFGLDTEAQSIGDRLGTIDPVAIDKALEEGSRLLLEGVASDVARDAIIDSLEKSSGQSIRTKDPFLSSILGDTNVPDVPLSSITRGAEPQVLISTINNTFTIAVNNDLSSVTDPSMAGSSVVEAFRALFRDEVSRASKMVKTEFAR